MSLTPKELYYYYSTDPCESINAGTNGAGTPYDLPALANFLKQLKYPCYSKAPYTQELYQKDDPSNSGILDSGKHKLALPYKILQQLDVEAFSEIQPNIRAGTAMAIRNACDITRSCDIKVNQNYFDWEHRMAYEHMTFFGGNQITDCLMMLGPDLIPPGDAMERGTGCGDLDCLPKFSSSEEGSALGAAFSCINKPDSGSKECSPCNECVDDDGTESNDPCCQATTCEQKMNDCCGDVVGERRGVFEYIPYGSDYPMIAGTNNNYYDDVFPLGYAFKHGGILKRKSYGGYVNLLNQSDGSLNSCPEDLLLSYMQKRNRYDYLKDEAIDEEATADTIDRFRTISLVYSENSGEMTSWIKDLVFNGYGVVIMTNVGFPNRRDSTGLSFPDRIWYHSFAIIGYDDRKTEYDDCVFLLANSWGDWNSGGHPSWGPIPEGSFLVTETHLQCMLNMYRTDKVGCRPQPNFTDFNRIEIEDGCVEDSDCVPWYCDKHQRALGFAFAMSINEGFPKKNIDYFQLYKTTHKYSIDTDRAIYQGEI